MSCVLCPASMCPLIAKDGSPWSGEKDAPCPEHDDLDTDGCPWWSMACGTGGIQAEVMQAKKSGAYPFVVGPNQPRHDIRDKSQSYDCPRASECSWQKQAGEDLCGPRLALANGIDPRVCLF